MIIISGWDSYRLIADAELFAWKKKELHDWMNNPAMEIAKISDRNLVPVLQKSDIFGNNKQVRFNVH